MMMPCLVLLLSLTSPSETSERDNSLSFVVQGDETPSLGKQIATLKKHFEVRERTFHDELVAANELTPEVRQRKILDENESFNKDRRAMADEFRTLIRANPAEPAAFEGIILLPGLMRSFLDEDLIKIVRDNFMNDPRMGRLCIPLAYRTEVWAWEILKDVAARHPDREVRGQATYSLGLWYRYSDDAMIMGRDRTEAEKGQNLTEASRCFVQILNDYADVNSAEKTGRLADKAKAELARIENLPNLRVGKAAPDILGEDLDGKPLRLSDHRGKVVAVVFWATWCGPCMAMVPHERDLVVRNQGKPFALLGVNSDQVEDREKAKQVTLEMKMTWPSWWDGGVRGGIQTAYDVRQWPTVYVLDPKGVIRYIDVRDKELEKAVETLLAEMKAGLKGVNGK